MGPGGIPLNPGQIKLNQTMNVAGVGDAVAQQIPTKRGKTSSRDVTPPEHRVTQSPQPMSVLAGGTPSLMVADAQ